MRAFLLFLFAMPALLSADPVKRFVTLDGTRLLTKPAAFSKSLGILHKGDMVMAEAAKNGYFRVTVKSGDMTQLQGYLSGRALQTSRPKIGSTLAKSSDASAEEVAAATKGFNKQVEAQYKKDNANLDYDQVTRLENRTRVLNPSESLKDFRGKGQLGEFSEEAK